MQIPPIVGLYFPLSHVLHLVLPTSDACPALQSEQESAFIVELRYSPALHGLHGVPASPASHLVHLALLGSDFSPIPHVSHFVEFG